MTVERVRVGDVLQLQRREVIVDPTAEYTLCGVYSFGKGIFHREPKVGAELGDYRFFAIEPGDLVVSNIQAWEGAIGLATEDDTGVIGTHRFLSYVPRDGRINTDWARWFFLSEFGMSLIRKAAPGSTIRNRTLAIERFESLTIPLPDINAQLATTQKLLATHKVSTYLRRRISDAKRVGQTMASVGRSGAIYALRSEDWRLLRLSDVAAINPGRQRVDGATKVAFVPMSAVDGTKGAITAPEIRVASEVGSGYKQFVAGDVIFARITPCMQNGKTAVFAADTGPAVGFGSTEFHVVRAGPEVTSAWLHCVMRGQQFRVAAAQTFTGTAGQQRVPARFLQEVVIPVPPVDRQHAIVAHVDRLDTKMRTLDRLHDQADRVAAALVPAALNEAFAHLSRPFATRRPQ